MNTGEKNVVDKVSLREKKLAQREKQNSLLLRKFSDVIADKTEKLLKEKLQALKPETFFVFAYMAKGNEVDLIRLYRRIWAGDINEKKSEIKLAFPKINKKRKMDFYIVKSEKNFSKGRFDILEPLIKDEESPVTKLDSDFVIFPGIAFNSEGYRIGYGGGYYDRYFAGDKKIQATFLGVAYDFQIENFSPEPHDIRLDMLISEEKIYTFPKLQKETGKNVR